MSKLCWDICFFNQTWIALDISRFRLSTWNLIINTYLLENLETSWQWDPNPPSWWELGVQPQSLGFVRTVLGLNIAPVHLMPAFPLKPKGSGWCSRYFGWQLFYQFRRKLKGRCWVSQHSSAWQEMMSRDCLLPGADSGSCGIYALAQCAIFIYSL